MRKKRFLVLFALAGLAWSATTATWETGSSAEFLKGRLKGLSLTPEGWLRPGPGPAVETSLNEPVLWSLIPAGDGGVYASTGHAGKVYHISRAGKLTELWTADQPEVFALCTDGKGKLYAGTSPNGAVYRIDEGQAVEVARFKEKYIWALAAGADGSVFAATGDQGRIYRIDPSGSAQVYFETGQSNVTSLQLGPRGHLYAGSEPNGLLYDITGARQGTVLFRSSLPEIHSVAVDANGAIFASALGGSLTSRLSAGANTKTAGSQPAVATAPTVITVTEAKENGVPEQNASPKPEGPRGTATSTITAAAPVAPSYVEVSGVDKSAIYRIMPDGAVDTLRTSKDENIYDLLLNGEQVWFSTDVHGRLYSLFGDRKQSLLAETGEADANRLIRTDAGIWVGLSNPAKVVLIGKSEAGAPSFESPVHDTLTLARWGRLSWQAAGTGISFRTRTGNSSRPDATWSPWSEPVRDPQNGTISSPRGRYIQWRAEWPAGASAELQSVVVPFLPQNSAPVVRSVSINSVGSSSQGSKSTSSNTQGAYTVTVTDSGDSSGSTSGTSSQTTNRGSGNQTQLMWQADDPDNDRLIYAVYFRGDDEKEWKLLKKDIFENTLTLDSDALADGKYLFRVVASDRPANDTRYAQQDEQISSPVLIDNTPPDIGKVASQRNGNVLTVTLSAVDKETALRKCEYSVDAGTWQPVEAADGITDSQSEDFKIEIPEMKAGEHVVAVRVYDAAGNAGLAKVIVH